MVVKFPLRFKYKHFHKNFFNQVEKACNTSLKLREYINLHFYNMPLTCKQFTKIYDYLRCQKVGMLGHK